jgi:hypothetical protein
MQCFCFKVHLQELLNSAVDLIDSPIWFCLGTRRRVMAGSLSGWTMNNRRPGFWQLRSISAYGCRLAKNHRSANFFKAIPKSCKWIRNWTLNIEEHWGRSALLANKLRSRQSILQHVTETVTETVAETVAETVTETVTETSLIQLLNK